MQDSPLFKQAQTALLKIDAQFRRKPDQLTDNAAATVAVAAQLAGLTRIDHLELGGLDNSKMFAVQGKLGRVHLKVVDVPTVDAMHTLLCRVPRLLRRRSTKWPLRSHSRWATRSAVPQSAVQVRRAPGGLVGRLPDQRGALQRADCV